MLSEDEIKKVASLARLELTPAEVTLYSKQLDAILEHVSDLKKINTEGVMPLVTPTEMHPTYREDLVQAGLDVEGVMQNAPEKSGHLYKVPPVI